jgi:hypothetical protein
MGGSWGMKIFTGDGMELFGGVRVWGWVENGAVGCA